MEILNYYSQYDQDKIVDLYFKSKKNGFFLDLGAHDGISCSNTYFFEKERNWTGICVEPIPDVYKLLTENRKSINYNVCISDKDGIVNFRRVNGAPEMLSGILEFMPSEHIDRINHECSLYNGSFEDIKVESKNINSILMKHGNPKIDFLSIDTEGAEFSILKTIDFEKNQIEFLTVENNNSSDEIRKYLKNKGYKLIPFITDDFFIKNSGLMFIFQIKVMYYLIYRIIKSKITSLKARKK